MSMALYNFLSFAALSNFWSFTKFLGIRFAICLLKKLKWLVTLAFNILCVIFTKPFFTICVSQNFQLSLSDSKFSCSSYFLYKFLIAYMFCLWYFQYSSVEPYLCHFNQIEIITYAINWNWTHNARFERPTEILLYIK